MFSGCHAREKNITPEIESLEFNLGDRTIGVTRTTYDPEGKITFIQLHDDEKTAVSAALKTISETGGTFITIHNNGNRNISFNWKGTTFKFDPNRIFSFEGRKQTLQTFHNYTASADSQVKLFADFILELVPGDGVVIAIHNNTNKRFSIDDYKKNRKDEALKVHINQHMDPDDFVITTEKSFYDQLVARNISTVLQHNEKIKDDGSLSVHYGKQGRAYVNIEAEHGHLQEQSEMIDAVIQIIGGLKE